MKPRRNSSFVAMFIGLLGLMRLFRDPRFEMYHTVDVVQLLASGMCFGVALCALFSTIRDRRIGSR